MGNFRHAVAEVELVTSRQTTNDQAGRPVFYTDSWNVRGQLQYEGAALLAAQNSLMAAYRADRVKLCSSAGLYYDTGAPTVYVWNAFNSIGGFRCVSGPDFPRGDSQQWVNCRDYDIRLECDFHHTLQSNTTEWMETLTIHGGGGQRLVGIECLYGDVEIQRTARSTPVLMIQEGRAVGRFRYPKEPPAYFPLYLNSPNCSRVRRIPHLQQAGGYGSQTDWETTWRYEMILGKFVDASPLPWNGT